MSAKSPARLSSGLLSRKGMAAPSAGPEARTNIVGSPLGTQGLPDAADAPDAETTWPRPRQVPGLARSTLADWVAPDPAAPAGARGRRGQVAQKRIRVSLRLDEDRHTRLKLVATQRNCTLQSLFTEAIDEFFVRHAPDLYGISAHLRRGAAATAGGKTKRGKRNSGGRNGPSRSR
jgi:predicted DNA-binding ribbon-helix-helix protein